MAKFQVELVTAEERKVSGDADFVRAPGAEGELGILSRHIPLMTPLRAGEVMVRNDGEEEYLFVAGGFLQVLPDRVVILADAAERAEEIDEARAEEARKRAQEALQRTDVSAEDAIAYAQALERAMLRLRVAELRRHRRSSMPSQLP
ncbi:MAG TPA: F0F1 ATP synthase subunit epsilon [Candidatus Dormibacteraeota bacterium]|nr:F0F1 ATP synthase subunit epsilon [Candidatus Dormibacteraeota bacterium]